MYRIKAYKTNTSNLVPKVLSISDTRTTQKNNLFLQRSHNKKRENSGNEIETQWNFKLNITHFFIYKNISFKDI